MRVFVRECVRVYSNVGGCEICWWECGCGGGDVLAMTACHSFFSLLFGSSPTFLFPLPYSISFARSPSTFSLSLTPSSFLLPRCSLSLIVFTDLLFWLYVQPEVSLPLPSPLPLPLSLPNSRPYPTSRLSSPSCEFV